LQRSRVTECLTEFTLYFVLWRKVELLEELRRDGDTAGRSDVAQGEILIHVVIQVLVTARAWAIPIT
jgi:hypothetical protein